MLLLMGATSSTRFFRNFLRDIETWLKLVSRQAIETPASNSQQSNQNNLINVHFTRQLLNWDQAIQSNK